MPHVLIVEDSDALGNALKILFEVSGYKVTLASSIKQTMCVKECPDAMLLDITLQDGDGLSLIPAMREAGNLPRYVIAVTGHDMKSVREECMAAGCHRVMIKPVPIHELLACVNGLLNYNNTPKSVS